MLVSATEAAKLTQKARQTINRHIREGKLSVQKKGGKRVIDTSELIRVYGEIKLPEVPMSSNKIAENVTQSSKRQEELIFRLMEQVSELTKKIEDLTLRLEYKSAKTSAQKAINRPEDDPEYPKEIKSPSDLLKRKEIREKY